MRDYVAKDTGKRDRSSHGARESKTQRNHEGSAHVSRKRMKEAPLSDLDLLRRRLDRGAREGDVQDAVLHGCLDFLALVEASKSATVPGDKFET